jgi:hypothetical protein
LKPAKILGNENAKMKTLQSTSITEIGAFPYAEIAGAPSLMVILSGKTDYFGKLDSVKTRTATFYSVHTNLYLTPLN